MYLKWLFWDNDNFLFWDTNSIFLIDSKYQICCIKVMYMKIIKPNWYKKNTWWKSHEYIESNKQLKNWKFQYHIFFLLLVRLFFT